MNTAIRIISGTHKGRRIKAPANLPVRPTTDFAKESLFNILNNRFDWEDVKALDLFSGTGSIAFEMASRGCPSVTAVDSHVGCWHFIRETAITLDLSDAVRVQKGNSFTFLKSVKEQYDLVFADPPFEMKGTETIPGIVFEMNLLKPGGLLVVEHPATLRFPPSEFFLEKRTYGNVNFSIFGRNETETE
ncbi:MAG: RNA methyltransferase, RsmD family [Bacteroidetes bacterium]|nr:MAG: RNA methyltransferase, RsmD family [Bacteroidota bacterium]